MAQINFINHLVYIITTVNTKYYVEETLFLCHIPVNKKKTAVLSILQYPPSTYQLRLKRIGKEGFDF